MGLTARAKKQAKATRKRNGDEKRRADEKKRAEVADQLKKVIDVTATSTTPNPLEIELTNPKDDSRDWVYRWDHDGLTFIADREGKSFWSIFLFNEADDERISVSTLNDVGEAILLMEES